MSALSDNDRLERIQAVWHGYDETLQRIKHELLFVKALLQVKSDCIIDGQRVWETALQKAEEGLQAGQSPEVVAANVEAELSPFAQLAKDYTVRCVGHAHIDMNWLWSWPETVEICHDTFTTVSKLMDEFPDFHFSQSQAATYHAMEQQSPDVFDLIKRRVADGQWEVTANLWVEGDKNLASGEALCRQILTAKRYFNEKLAYSYDKVKIAFEPDTFGHATTLPQILCSAGISHYYFCRAGKEHQLFWWQAPNGDRVLAWNDSKLWYLGPVKPEYAMETIRHEQVTGMKDYLLVYGVGDHGGGPTRRDLKLIQQMDKWPIWPRFQFSTFAEYFHLAEVAGDRLPVLEGELNFVFRGCYTSQSNIKRANRFSENMLVRSETMATVASVNGWLPYPRADFTSAWQKAAFNQFHDILPGSGVKQTYEYAQGLFQSIRATAGMAWKRAAEQLVSRLPREGAGRPAVVFNSLPWQRTEGVVARVYDMSRNTKNVAVTDANGQSVMAQVVGAGGYWGHDYVDVAWSAQAVPGVGYSTYWVRAQEIAADLLGIAVNPDWSGNKGKAVDWPDSNGAWAAADGRMQNEFYRLKIEPESGTIVSLIDRKTGDELALTGGRLGLLQVLYEAPHGMSAWEIGQITRTIDLLQGGRTKTVETGPARAMIRTEHTLGDSNITVEFTLCAGVPRVDIRVKASWLEVGSARKDAPMLKMAFPLALSGVAARFEAPFGSVERPADGAEVPTQQWANLRGVTRSGEPYSVALLNDSKYGCDVLGSTMRMTLLRSSYEPDPYPEVGKHEFNLALVCQDGNMAPGQATRAGQAFNNALQALALYAEGAPQTGAIATAVLTQAAGTVGVGAVEAAETAEAVLPAGGGYLALAPDSVGFSALKLAEDSDHVVLRIWETDGVATMASITPGWTVSEAIVADTLEQPGDVSYEPVDGVLSVPLQPYEIRTLLLRVE